MMEGYPINKPRTQFFDLNGFNNHVTYQSDVDQNLSLNDNRLYGCKST